MEPLQRLIRFGLAPFPQNKAEIAKIARKIKAEADVNKDGKIDSEELKAILKKYPASFRDQTISDIGELFYTTRGGESVNHHVSGLRPDQPNPLFNPEEKFERVLKT